MMGAVPRLLDRFCGAGGAAVGYHRAGFEVVGVDIKPQPHYPFQFFQADALEFLEEGLDYTTWDQKFDWYADAIHASPPCQRYSTATKRNGTENEHPDLIAETRTMLKASGLPYVIENVVGAPLEIPILLCGTAFGLEADGYRLKRHRLFELSWDSTFWFESGCRCWSSPLPIMDVTGGGPTHKERTDGGGGRTFKGTADQARRIMDIDWMTKTELNEAIPPAYTEFIGAELLKHVRLNQAA
jgi:DNA (cytosine-5)-methyltransferase 1